jgi:hypothetical protein
MTSILLCICMDTPCPYLKVTSHLRHKASDLLSKSECNRDVVKKHRHGLKPRVNTLYLLQMKTQPIDFRQLAFGNAARPAR